MKLIVLDRDGVINEDSDEYIKSVDEWIPIPGSMEAIARLNRGGFRVVVATNQSGISRGMFDLETLSAMHKKCMNWLALLAGTLRASSSAHMAPMTNAIAASPNQACFRKFRHVRALTWKACLAWVIHCATCKPVPAWAVAHFWSKPARAKKLLKKAKTNCPKAPWCSTI